MEKLNIELIERFRSKIANAEIWNHKVGHLGENALSSNRVV